MKKLFDVFSILAITLLAFGATSSALAAEPQRGGPGTSGGYGNQGDLGTGTGVPVEQNIALEGIMTPESGAAWLQEQVEGLLAERSK